MRASLEFNALALLSTWLSLAILAPLPPTSRLFRRCPLSALPAVGAK